VKTINTIVHPTDFSNCGEAAFDVACALAREYDARLNLVHVSAVPVSPPPLYAVPPPTEAPVNQPLEKLIEMQSARPNVKIEVRVLQGEPVEQILAEARASHCDMIVMGTHGRTGLAHLLMGSVAEEIVRRAPCSVLTVKPPKKAEPSYLQEAVEQAILP
jgi:nucleotide-binding universal stress UspA family protein